ncbi:MAG: thiamine phosphate synthase [Candidatus Omnitrophota bacterium]
MRMKGYYFITDSSLSRSGIVSDTKAALRAGVKIVQYREKSASSRQMYQEAKKLRKVCARVTFLVNDRIDIALSVGADGVHIGQSDLALSIARKLLGKKKIIGVTVHNVKEALAAQAQGADYLAVAPIFATSTKKDAGKPAGIKLLARIKQKVAIPVVAIGGINLAHADKVVQAGADAFCAISEVVTKSDVKAEIKKFQRYFD